MSATVVKQKAPSIRMNAKEHFWVKGLKRAFDLSALVPLYIHVSKNIDNIERGVDLEWNTGRTTIIYSVDEFGTIHLISGWPGNRKKEKL